MPSELKCCPFCGALPDVAADMTDHPEVSCDACGATIIGEGISNAVEKWNRRVLPPEVRAVLFAHEQFKCLHRHPDEDAQEWAQRVMAQAAKLAHALDALAEWAGRQA